MATEFTGTMYLHLKFPTVEEAKSKLSYYFDKEPWIEKYITYLTGGVPTVSVDAKSIKTTRTSYAMTTEGVLVEIDCKIGGQVIEVVTVGEEKTNVTFAQKLIDYLKKNAEVAQYVELLSVDEAILATHDKDVVKEAK